MDIEYSCGVVLYTRLDGEVKYVLVIQPDFVFGLPKGHMEGTETERETALREVREETGITPKLIDGFCERIEYEIPSKPGVMKRVAYFLGEYDCDSPLIVPAHELVGLCRVPYEQATELIKHDGLKAVLAKANSVINK